MTCPLPRSWNARTAASNGRTPSGDGRIQTTLFAPKRRDAIRFGAATEEPVDSAMSAWEDGRQLRMRVGLKRMPQRRGEPFQSDGAAKENCRPQRVVMPFRPPAYADSLCFKVGKAAQHALRLAFMPWLAVHQG